MPTLNINDPKYFNPFLKTLEDNTFKNYHTENCMLITYSFGNRMQKEEMKEIFKDHNDERYGYGIKMMTSIARKYLKEINLDYAHGTGHGVGYFLNVHEGPHGISKGNKTTFNEGVIISNEPGYYKKNEFGIRIENLITVKKKKSGFVFKNLTLVPIEKSLIEKKLLNKNEINWINKYHAKVFNCLKKLMNKSELLELRSLCSNI